MLANAALVDLERSKLLTFDLLLTFLVHPGTAIYIGYADRYENFALDPAASSGLRRVGGPGLSTGRTFFIKVSYLLRF
ncbi:MAG: hypothetical protein HY237_11105 [Acidobacteria bacterium]|nr:hypothetical protein [Acidobacteriota bacterium]